MGGDNRIRRRKPDAAAGASGANGSPTAPPAPAKDAEEVDVSSPAGAPPHWWAGLAAVALTVLLFSNAVAGAGYVQDDQRAIESNKDVDGTTPWSAVFLNDFWGTPLDQRDSHKSYRPVAVAWMRVLAAQFGKNAEVLKVGNIFWHAVCVLLVHELCRRVLFRDDAWKCWWATLLFAFHPVHNESILGLVGVADLISMAFALLAVMLYKTSVLGVCACLVVSSLSKEVGLTVGVPIIYLLAVDADARLSTKRRVVYASGIAATFVAVMALRQYLAGGQQLIGKYEMIDNMLAFIDDTATFYLTMANVWYFYLKLLLWPTNLSSDYSYNQVPAVEPTAGNIAFYATFVAIAAGLALYLLARHRGVVPCFSVVFFLASFFPASQLLYRPGCYIAERLMYTPSFAVCVFAVWLMTSRAEAAQSPTARRLRLVWHVFFLAACVAFVPIMRHRNECWLTSSSMWRCAYEVAPNSARVLLSHGVNEVKLSRPRDVADAGVNFLLRALEVAPTQCQSKYWIGRYHVEHTKDYREALRWMWEATKCRVQNHHEYGYDAIEAVLLGYIQSDAKVQDYVDLARAYYEQGKWDMSESVARQGLEKFGEEAERAARGALNFYIAYALVVNVPKRTEGRGEEGIRRLVQFAAMTNTKAPLYKFRDRAAYLILATGYMWEREDGHLSVKFVGPEESHKLLDDLPPEAAITEARRSTS